MRAKVTPSEAVDAPEADVRSVAACCAATGEQAVTLDGQSEVDGRGDLDGPAEVDGRGDLDGHAEVDGRDDPDGHAEVRPRKILIVSADIGEGHDLPARAVAREFKEEDPHALVAIVNGLAAMGRIPTMVLRENSEFMFRWLPWLFDLQYRLFMDFAPTRWLAARLLSAFGRRGMMRLIRAHEPDLIVSTYPGTTQVLGELRRTGRLKVPCYSSITDLAGLRYWAHPGIDMHFITHPESQEEVERIAGPGSVRWAKPPTAPTFMTPRAREDARAALDLPLERTVITVSGGGWGVGDVIGAVRTVLAVAGDVEVLALCGHNSGLRQRVSQAFAGDPRVRVMGFTRRMGDVLAASDALIHSSVGLTVLEAIIRGCPVISYGFGYGHVRVSNQALERFKLAQVARDQEELGRAVLRALELKPEPDSSFARRASTASMILNGTRRITPLPRWRVRTVRGLTTTAAAVAVGLWTFTAGVAYSLIAPVAGPMPVSAVTTARQQVGLMVDVSAGQAAKLARDLRGSDMRLSFAIHDISPGAADAVIDAHDEPLPQLSDSGLVGWVSTDHHLHQLKVHVLERELRWGDHFLYASTGPSLAQALLAHRDGGRLIEGRVRLEKSATLPRGVHAGWVIELRVKNVARARAQLREIRRELRRHHLNAVPVGTLLKDSGTSI